MLYLCKVFSWDTSVSINIQVRQIHTNNITTFHVVPTKRLNRIRTYYERHLKAISALNVAVKQERQKERRVN